MQKTITISSITGKFTKDFDTFGKMDPFIEVKCGTFTQKSQVANDQGKQPKWTKTFTFSITNQKQIQINAYDEDVTENQFMGTNKIEIVNLKTSANQQLILYDKDKKSVGSITFKYQIKQTTAPIKTQQKVPTNNLKEAPNTNTLQKNINEQLNKNVVASDTQIKGTGDKKISLTNIYGKITKDFDLVGKMDVFLKFYLGKEQLMTQQAADMGLQPKWKKNINFAFNQQTQIIVKAFDSDVTEEQYMGNGTINIKSLKDSGKSQVILYGQDKKSIGTIFFNYQLKVPKPIVVQAPKPVVVQKKVEPIKQQPKIQKKVQPQPPKEQPKIQKKVEQPVSKQEPKIQKKVEQPVKEEPKKIPTQPSKRKSEQQIIIQKADVTIERKPVYIEKPKQQQKNINDSNVSKKEQHNKSINSIRLPHIGDISRNFGDKIFDKQSSATLQKSILVYSMPKAPRFGSGPKYCGQPSYYVDTCFKPNATKGVGFGFGSKRQFPEWMQKNMKENPAPGSYFEDSNRKGQYKQKGPTFGISYKYYQKVTIPKQKSPEKNTISTKRLAPILRSK